MDSIIRFAAAWQRFSCLRFERYRKGLSRIGMLDFAFQDFV